MTVSGALVYGSESKIRTMPVRMKKLKGGDPLFPVVTEKPDLIAALERLAKLTG